MKKKNDSFIKCYKARIIVRRFSQKHRVDFNKTFNLVAKLTTVRMLISLVASKGWSLWLLDVKNALLYGDLDKDIYIVQLFCFVDPVHPKFVCKLKKPLYSLKQIPRVWYKKIVEYLLFYGFSLYFVESGLFVKHSSKGIIIVYLYVDNLIVTSDDVMRSVMFRIAIYII